MERLPRPPESFFEGTPPRVRAYIDALHDFIDRSFAAFEARIAELEAKLARCTCQQVRGKGATNSSLPPSMQHPHAKPAKPARNKARKKRGGQPGHAKHERPLQPTNNTAERALRHPVIWRKLSFGTQSAKGSRFVETLLAVIETCRQQHRNVFDFVAQTISRHFHHEPTPSLRPAA